MSWWLAVPLALLIVVGAIGAFVGFTALLFRVMDALEKRFGKDRVDSIGAIFALVLSLAGLIGLVALMAYWFATGDSPS